jgi:hypothetical protein
LGNAGYQKMANTQTAAKIPFNSAVENTTYLICKRTGIERLPHRGGATHPVIILSEPYEDTFHKLHLKYAMDNTVYISDNVHNE